MLKTTMPLQNALGKYDQSQLCKNEGRVVAEKSKKSKKKKMPHKQMTEQLTTRILL